MSLIKAQLVNPIGILTASGVNITGITTSGGINVTGILTANTVYSGIVSITSATVGILTASTANDSSGNLRDIPQNSQTSAYILQASDAGKHISITTGGITIPAAVFDVGDAVTIYNNSGTNQLVAPSTSVTLRKAGTGTIGTRVVSQYGLVTILCVSNNVFVITGSGLD